MSYRDAFRRDRVTAVHAEWRIDNGDWYAEARFCGSVVAVGYGPELQDALNDVVRKIEAGTVAS